MQKTKLYYGGLPGSGYGWGTCNTYLIRELGKLCNLVKQPTDDCILFMPLADHDFNPVGNERGRINLAYTFFEFPLGPNAKQNAAKYDVVFCGSTWCLEQMKRAGIKNGKVLVQGVDHSIFKPRKIEREDSEFRLFSGGKLELRKGQDIVLEVFSRLCKQYSDMRLLTAWYNPWPETARSLDHSPYKYAQVPMNRVTQFGCLTAQQLSELMLLTDLGIFPNRCEGGTNLVMMEYAAVGKPFVASYATGHLDVLTKHNCFPLTKQAEIRNLETMRWFEPNVETLVNMVAEVYEAHKKYLEGGREYHSPDYMAEWTWERTARAILSEIPSLTSTIPRLANA